MSEPLIRTNSPSANRDIAAGKFSAGLQNRTLSYAASAPEGVSRGMVIAGVAGIVALVAVVWIAS